MNQRQSATPRRVGRARAAISRLALSPVTRDTSLVALGQTLFKGSFYVASIGLSRSLTVEQFAAFGYLTASSRFLSIFFSAGLTIAATKAFADASANAREGEQTAAVVVLMLAAALFASATSPLYMPLLSDNAIRLHGAWIVGGAAAQGAYSIALSGMFGASAFRRLLAPLAVGSAALMLGAAASALTGDILPVLIGYILFFLAPSLLFGINLYKRGPLTAVRPSRKAVRSVALTALPTLASGIISAGVIWLVFRVLLENAGSTAEFNKFVIGMQWLVLVLFVPNALGNALFPRFLHGAREGRLGFRVAGGVALSVFTTVGLLALLGLLLTPALSDLYGYQFSRGFVLAILAAAALGGAATMLSYAIMAALGVARWLAVNLVTLVTIVGLLTLWPPVTALDAALILCGGNGAVLLAELLTLLGTGRRKAA